ncbi:tRNA -methyltransferase [Golovinomyces cichoracearum]|uniref:tRNA (guanine(9)-N1)-methyltransferase n=1 Tax=Golovinomyces cichoracearum TaxID=62708 RepID=A0A420I6C7_9PEZI|nr:tRNA -methyltransferase [Golovinomyces cichoracearum]
MSSSTQDMEESRPCKVRKLDLSDVSQNVENAPSQVTTSTIRLENLVRGEKDQGHDNNDDGNDEEVLSVGREEDEPQVNNNISKNQLKKLKKREIWEANRELRTKKRREKHKEKQLRKALQRKELSSKILEKKGQECDDRDSSQFTEEDGEKKSLPPPKKHRRPTQVSIGLILDTAFNALMTEKEIISLGAQLTRCYSLNKNAHFRTHLAISSWGGTLKSRFENVLANTHLHWTGVVFLEDGDFIEAGKLLHEKMTEASTKISPQNPSVDGESKDDCDVVLPVDEELLESSTSHVNSESSVHEMLPSMTENPSLVYLTSDSPNTLTHLSPNTSYIIGGIVDKNRHKGICYKRACERGIPTAKLPIGEFMDMQSRTVLTVNHVVEIMLKWLETKNWGEAFLQVIPKRKQAVLKIEKNAKTQLGNCDEEKCPNASVQGAAKIKLNEADKLVNE